MNKLHPAAQPAQPESLLRLAEVERRTGLCKTSLYAAMRKGDFPKRLKLPGSRAVAWPSSQIDEWIAAQIRASVGQA